MATEKIDITDLFDEFLKRINKHMSVSMGNRHTDRMFKSVA